MNITILTDESSWINEYMSQLVSGISAHGHSVYLVHKVSEIVEGDLAFFLGCGQLVPPLVLKLNRHNLVVHESDLPKGRGWSPLTWQVLEGINEIPIVLFEATESVDSGIIYLQDKMSFTGYELIDDLRKVQAETSIRMCHEFVERYPEIVVEGKEQQGEPTFYIRRTPKDSRLDPDRTIREQFNLLRVVDNEQYPAYFELNGKSYILRIVME